MPRRNNKKDEQQPCTSKQLNLKDMIRESRNKQNQLSSSNEEEENATSTTKVISTLLRHNDITEPNYDDISIETINHYIKHSNIKDILHKYLEDRKINNTGNIVYMKQVIRAVTSTKNSKRKYPFNEFKWNTIHDEMVGKNLLMHPDISTPDDVQEVNKFYKNNDIRLCSVNLTINNNLYKDCKEYLDVKRKKYGSKKLFDYYPHASDFAIEKYLRETKNQKIYELQDITLEEMCMISNFEMCIRKEKIKGITITSDKLVRIAMETKLRKLKENPETLYDDLSFSIKPQYILRTNNVTQQQELFLARKKQRFYDYSNAKFCLLMNKLYYPSNLENPPDRDNERQKNFYLDYVRSKDRKYPPFHNLLWDKQYKLNEDGKSVRFVGGDPVLEEQLYFEERIQKDDFDEIQREEVDNEAIEPQINQVSTANEISSSSEINQVTMISQKPTTSSADELNNDEIEFSDYEEEIVKILFQDHEFISAVKNQLRVKYLESFKEIWKNKKVVVFNLIVKTLREDQDAFEKLINHSSSDNKAKVEAILSANNINIDSSFTTSTQYEDIRSASSHASIIGSKDSVRRPLQLDEDSLHDIIPVVQQKVNENSKVKEVEIKKEKMDDDDNDLHQPTTPSDSCVIVTQALDEVVEIIDSDDESDKTLKELRYSDHSLDEFQRNMNKDSDEIDWSHLNEKPKTVVENNSPYTDITEMDVDEENKSQNSNDKKSQSSTDIDLLDIPPNKPVSNFGKKRSRKPTKGLEFLSDTLNNSSEETSGNECNTGEVTQMLNANFSIFLSTQVMLDHDTNMVEPTAMTFTQSTTSASSEIGKMCFYMELRQVIYKKDSVFQIVVDIPEYALRDITINDENIKEVLNLNDIEWNILLSNLNQLESYEYGVQSHQNYQINQFEKLIAEHLDMYFSTMPKFKNFILNFSADGHTYQIQNPAIPSYSTDLTDVLSKDLTDRIKLIK